MNPKVRKRIITALLFSIFCHIAFLVWSYFVKILPALPFPEKPEAVFHIKIDRQEHLGQERLKFETDFSRKSPKPDNPFTENMTNKSTVESEELVKNNIESSIQKNKQELVSASVKEEQIIKKSEFNDILSTKKVRRAPRENLVELGEVPHENFSSGYPVLNSGEDISKYFLDKSAIPAKVSLVAPMQSANVQNEFQLMKRSSAGIEHESKSMDLGTALTYQLFKYQDNQGQKYFKLIVKVRDATIDFPVIPKEIIFLLDASGSIGMERLNQEEDGIMFSLTHLNPNDRFNIIVFKDKTIPFSPASVKSSPENVKNAIEFLQGLKSWSTTDIYGALRASINLKSPFIPSYRVFISDGIPTVGVVDDRHVINEISNLNDNKVSIFTFGGGPDVDPYMLDFIAFKNRGWSTVVDRKNFMAREFSNFYNEIKDPLLLNVRYYVSGLNAQEIFPQTMPDFFKGSQFVVYGKYTDEDKFALQIRGDAENTAIGEIPIGPFDKKEFIVTASLMNAAAGDKQVAREWAFHKVYYLISQLKYDENNGPLIKEINDLCSKFQIITPYSFSYESISRQETQQKGQIKERQQANPVLKK